MERLHMRHKYRTAPSRCDGGCSVLLVLMSCLGAQEKSICLLEVNFLVTELMLFRESMSASLDTTYKGSFL